MVDQIGDILDVAGGEKPILVEVDTSSIDKYFRENAIWIFLVFFIVMVASFTVGALVARKLG